MGRGHYGPLLLAGCARALGGCDYSVGRVRVVSAHGCGRHVGSQGRERVL